MFESLEQIRCTYGRVNAQARGRRQRPPLTERWEILFFDSTRVAVVCHGGGRREPKQILYLFVHRGAPPLAPTELNHH